MVWHTGPLTPLGGLGGMLGDSSAADHAPLVSSACWLDTQCQPATKEIGGILAVGTVSQVVLIEITMR